jgi:sarcosine oxidase, subunit gamma
METLNPEWVEVQAMRVPKRIGDAAAETAAVTDLALCDVSALRKFGVKGRGAPAWLEGRGVRLPTAIYDYESLGDGGTIMRVTADEFFLEEGLSGDRVSTLKSALGGGQDGAYAVERQDAGFLLSGSRALEVIAQTCAIDFDTEPDHVVMSRVAGVSCTVLARRIDAGWIIWLWCSPSFAHYLGGQLLEITRDRNGLPVGLDSIKHLL